MEVAFAKFDQTGNNMLDYRLNPSSRIITKNIKPIRHASTKNQWGDRLDLKQKKNSLSTRDDYV